MADEITIILPGQLEVLGIEYIPRIITSEGRNASQRFIEFFTANIRNKNTRLAYAKAVSMFFGWCEDRGLSLSRLQPSVVAIYIEKLQQTHSAPSVKLHLAAIRMFFD